MGVCAGKSLSTVETFITGQIVKQMDDIQFKNSVKLYVNTEYKDKKEKNRLKNIINVYLQKDETAFFSDEERDTDTEIEDENPNETNNE